jgi:hypothetical protein
MSQHAGGYLIAGNNANGPPKGPQAQNSTAPGGASGAASAAPPCGAGQESSTPVGCAGQSSPSSSKITSCASAVRIGPGQGADGGGGGGGFDGASFPAGGGGGGACSPKVGYAGGGGGGATFIGPIVTDFLTSAALPSNQQSQETSTFQVFASQVAILAESPEARFGTTW